MMVTGGAPAAAGSGWRRLAQREMAIRALNIWIDVAARP
jgi:hypothetical protein